MSISPLGSASKLKAALETAISAARQRGRLGPRHEQEEGPVILARAYDLLRLYAYPNDTADWGVLGRARRHRQWMGRSQEQAVEGEEN
jgi:hypothetical protein